jgi:hypothetical protein
MSPCSTDNRHASLAMAQGIWHEMYDGIFFPETTTSLDLPQMSQGKWNIHYCHHLS